MITIGFVFFILNLWCRFLRLGHFKHVVVVTSEVYTYILLFFFSILFFILMWCPGSFYLKVLRNLLILTPAFFFFLHFFMVICFSVLTYSLLYASSTSPFLLRSRRFYTVSSKQFYCEPHLSQMFLSQVP